ncbi:MAG: GNAT family N-acetyltransferase [Candidatus Thorarchaeota archaeon]
MISMYDGKTTRLRRLTSDDAEKMLQYWNLYELRQYLAAPLPSTKQDLIEYIDSVNNAFANRKGFTFGIEVKETGFLVGIINLVNISWLSRNGEIGVFAILDKKDRGKGYAQDAITVLLDFAFNVIDLHNVYLMVAGFNDRAINFYDKIGFKGNGRIREMAFRNGKRYDVIIMDILRSEFIDRYGILPKTDAP